MNQTISKVYSYMTNCHVFLKHANECLSRKFLNVIIDFCVIRYRNVTCITLRRCGFSVSYLNDQQ